MKAIILAGGKGSRLYPMTQNTSKQLLPIYDKPMIYYPLGMLMLCGFRDVLIICTPETKIQYRDLLGDGSHLGLSLSYATQAEPKGLPEAFIIGEKFINRQNVALLLGDNLFYGAYDTFRESIQDHLQTAGESKARVFAYKVTDPERYGVISYREENGRRIVNSLEEKPSHPKSSYAIPGFYLFSGDVSSRAKELRPSARGETEIVELLRTYQEQNQLFVDPIGRGMAWLDTGTPDSLLEAGEFVAAIEKRQGLKIGCLEEIAFSRGYITAQQLSVLAQRLPSCSYRQYIEGILNEL